MIDQILFIFAILVFCSLVLWCLMNPFQEPPNNCPLLPANLTFQFANTNTHYTAYGYRLQSRLSAFSIIAFTLSMYDKIFLIAISQFWDLKKIFPIFLNLMLLLKFYLQLLNLHLHPWGDMDGCHQSHLRRIFPSPPLSILHIQQRLFGRFFSTHFYIFKHPCHT